MFGVEEITAYCIPSCILYCTLKTLPFYSAPTSEHLSERQRIQLELEGLRQARQSGLLARDEDDLRPASEVSERQRMQYELEALRQARQQTSCISRLSRGDPARRSLRRSHSSAAIEGKSGGIGINFSRNKIIFVIPLTKVK